MATRSVFLAGWASIEITPDVPCWMGGYAARTAPADAVHDPLSARALALGTQEQPFVVILCDLLAVDEMMRHEVHAQVAMRHPNTTVWLGATHTHSGPDVARLLSHAAEPSDPEIRARILAGASRAAEAAIACMHPVAGTWTSGEIKSIATDRDHPDKSVSLSLDMLCFYDIDEQLGTEERQAKPAALFANFPCHPTVLGAENLALSADLPGAFRRHLHALVGDDPWIALATGAAGDISTRHMRQGQGFDELERLGGLLAAQASALLPLAQPLTLDLPRVHDTVVELEQKEPLAPETLAAYTHSVQARMRLEQHADDIARLRTLETVLQGLSAAQTRASMRVDPARNVAVSAAILGEVALVAVPGELYNALGAAIKREARRFVLLLGYTNGYVGYIPTREAYAELDYEVLVSPFAPGSGERLVNALETLHL